MEVTAVFVPVTDDDDDEPPGSGDLAVHAGPVKRGGALLAVAGEALAGIRAG